LQYTKAWPRSKTLPSPYAASLTWTMMTVMAVTNTCSHMQRRESNSPLVLYRTVGSITCNEGTATTHWCSIFHRECRLHHDAHGAHYQLTAQHQRACRAGVNGPPSGCSTRTRRHTLMTTYTNTPCLHWWMKSSYRTQFRRPQQPLQQAHQNLWWGMTSPARDRDMGRCACSATSQSAVKAVTCTTTQRARRCHH
jgi:hypothetical protein